MDMPETTKRVMYFDNSLVEVVYKYITFSVIEGAPTGNKKTASFFCRNNKSGANLGVIRWYGAWRQYCYFPAVEGIYSAGCLDDISEFIQDLMVERKDKIKELMTKSKDRND